MRRKDQRQLTSFDFTGDGREETAKTNAAAIE